MEFISTKNMSNKKAPKGQVLIQYLEPFFGGWSVEFAIGYFDNPLDYEGKHDARGWCLWFNDRQINVIAYAILPDVKVKSKFESMTQQEFHNKYGEWQIKLGNVGE